VSRADRIGAGEEYLRSRTGCYDYRAVRYNAAVSRMVDMGLDDDSLVVDVGAGWTELDFCLRTDWGWRGRYYPVDGMLDGTDLESWVPPRRADFFVALEILEHLRSPGTLLENLIANANRGVVVSVPNPRTTDVLGMDRTHVTVVREEMLCAHGLTVEEHSFYGKPRDSLFGWRSA
jgi:hypothetical protein